MNKPKLLIKKSLLQMAENSIGSNTFRNFFVQMEDGTEVDVLKDGDLSCAVFVSGLLAALGLIDEGHATVDSTIKALVEAGWEEIGTDNPEAGDIIMWDEKEFENGTKNKHVGFYMGDDMAISNSAEERSPQKHDWTYNSTRPPLKLFRCDFESKL